MALVVDGKWVAPLVEKVGAPLLLSQSDVREALAKRNQMILNKEGMGGHRLKYFPLLTFLHPAQQLAIENKV